MALNNNNKPRTPMHELVVYFDKQIDMLKPFAEKDPSMKALIELTKKHQAKAIDLMETEMVALRHAWNDLMFDSFINYVRYFYQDRK